MCLLKLSLVVAAELQRRECGLGEETGTLVNLAAEAACALLVVWHVARLQLISIVHPHRRRF